MRRGSGLVTARAGAAALACLLVAGVPAGGQRVDRIHLPAPTMRVGGSVWEAAGEPVGAVVDAKLLGDGGVVFFDSDAAALRLVDAEGTTRWSVGRRGRGPEEWSRWVLGLVVLPGDTVLVADQGNGRLVSLAASGAFVGSVPYRDPVPADEWHATAGGRVMYDRIFRPESLKALDADRTGARVVYSFAYGAAPDRRGDTPIATPLAPEGRWTLVGEALVTGVSNQDTIRVSDLGTGVETRFTLGRAPRAPTRSERRLLERLWARRLELGGIPPDLAARIVVEQPETLPVMGHVAAGPDGNVWIQRPAPLESIEPAELRATPFRGTGGLEWDVYTLAGELRATVVFPYRLRVLDCRRSTLLTLRIDEWGRDLLETWSVPRAAGQGRRVENAP